MRNHICQHMSPIQSNMPAAISLVYVCQYVSMSESKVLLWSKPKTGKVSHVIVNQIIIQLTTHIFISNWFQPAKLLLNGHLEFWPNKHTLSIFQCFFSICHWYILLAICKILKKNHNKAYKAVHRLCFNLKNACFML